MTEILQIFQESWWKNANGQTIWFELFLIAFLTFLLGWLVSWLFRKSYQKLWSYNERLLKDQYSLNDQLRADIKHLSAENRKISYELQKSKSSFAELKEVSIQYISEVHQSISHEMKRISLEKEALFSDLKTAQRNEEAYLLGLRQSREKNRELVESLRNERSILATEKSKWSGQHDQLLLDFQKQASIYQQRLSDLEAQKHLLPDGNSQPGLELIHAREENENLRKLLEQIKNQAEEQTQDLNGRLQKLQQDNGLLSAQLQQIKNELQHRLHEVNSLHQRLASMEVSEKELSDFETQKAAFELEKMRMTQAIDALQLDNKNYGINLNDLYHSLQLKEEEYKLLQRQFLSLQQVLSEATNEKQYLHQEKEQLLQIKDQLQEENESNARAAREIKNTLELTIGEKADWEYRYNRLVKEKSKWIQESQNLTGDIRATDDDREKNNGFLRQLEAAARVVMAERDEKKRMVVEHEKTIFALQQKFRNEKQYYEEHIRNLESKSAGLEKELQEINLAATDNREKAASLDNRATELEARLTYADRLREILEMESQVRINEIKERLQQEQELNKVLAENLESLWTGTNAQNERQGVQEGESVLQRLRLLTQNYFLQRDWEKQGKKISEPSGDSGEPVFGHIVAEEENAKENYGIEDFSAEEKNDPMPIDVGDERETRISAAPIKDFSMMTITGNDSVGPGAVYAAQNDLQKVYHLTKEVEKLFNENGIFTLFDLARKKPEQLREILGEAGKHFIFFDYHSWPRQAQLLVEGRQLELEILVKEILESEKFNLF